MIIIITKKTIKFNDTYVINEPITLLDDYHLTYKDRIIDFDYLIIEDLTLVNDIEKTKVLMDEQIPVTNFFGQTSIEHIYVGDIDNALDHLYNGD